jgi:hypothetical protein
MKTSTLLRIAAVLMFLYFVGHTFGAPWTPGEAPADIAVVNAMKSDHFPVIGTSRSYWDFYFGFGLVISVMQLLQAVVLWQLGSLARTDAARLRPIIAAFFLSLVVNAILGWMYFFAIPIVMALLIAICLLLAFVSARRTTATAA